MSFAVSFDTDNTGRLQSLLNINYPLVVSLNDYLTHTGVYLVNDPSSKLLYLLNTSFICFTDVSPSFPIWQEEPIMDYIVFVQSVLQELPNSSALNALLESSYFVELFNVVGSKLCRHILTSILFVPGSILSNRNSSFLVALNQFSRGCRSTSSSPSKSNSETISINRIPLYTFHSSWPPSIFKKNSCLFEFVFKTKLPKRMNNLMKGMFNMLKSLQTRVLNGGPFLLRILDEVNSLNSNSSSVLDSNVSASSLLQSKVYQIVLRCFNRIVHFSLFGKNNKAAIQKNYLILFLD
ncbi:hypothetical protein P9112_011868 [Eukaryota sp. TZLM1-RC]